MTDDQKDKKDEGTTNYYNSTDSQIVVNSKGTIIGGGEWADLEETPQVRKAVEAGELVEVKSPEEQAADAKEVEDAKEAEQKAIDEANAKTEAKVKESTLSTEQTKITSGAKEKSK